jgi:molybdate transport system substrate-binding protein
VRAPQRSWALAAAALLLVAGCGASSSSGDGDGDGGASVTVLAASSLQDVFGDVAGAFEHDHPGVDVHLSFEGSSRLVAQITVGAPADVFASADAANMARVVDAGLVEGTPVVIATNRLAIAVAPGNPLGISSLADVAGRRLALCAPEVPCGRYTAQAFAAAGLDVPAASTEGSVRAALTKVVLGEADAAVVYATDITATDGVEGVDLPAAQAIRATYPAAALTGAAPRGAAADFVAFLTSAPAQAILTDAGFGLP